MVELVRQRSLLWCALGCFSLVGCQTTMYEWGQYDAALYAHYREATSDVQFAEALAEVIAKAEASDKQVPPGLYAEYGAALMELGEYDEAIRYFSKEGDMWPESRVFMDRLIASMSDQASELSGVP